VHHLNPRIPNYRLDEARRELSQAIEDCLAFGSPYWAARSERVLAQL
jgi:fatty acid desaturase